MKKLHFSVTSEATSGGDTEKHVSAVRGVLSENDGTIFLHYPENTEGGRIMTEIQIRGNSVKIRRSGAVISLMEFAPGKKHDFIYSVPPYRFDASIITREVLAPGPGERVTLSLVYDLTLGGETRRMLFCISEKAGEVR